MSKAKLRLTKEDYRRYGVTVPFYQSTFAYLIIFAAILVIDAYTLFKNIDLSFPDNAENMSKVITASVCLVIDIVPIVVTDVLRISARGKRALPWIGMGLIACVIGFLMVQRIFSSDEMFAAASINDSLLDTEASHAQPYQVMINILLGVIPLITTIFGIIYTLRRNRIHEEMLLVRNKAELELLMTQKFELEQAQAMNHAAMDEDELLYQSICDQVHKLHQIMLVEKNDSLAKALKDPYAVSRISVLKYGTNRTPSSQTTAVSGSAPIPIPLAQVSYSAP